MVSALEFTSGPPTLLVTFRGTSTKGDLLTDIRVASYYSLDEEINSNENGIKIHAGFMDKLVR